MKITSVVEQPGNHFSWFVNRGIPFIILVSFLILAEGTELRHSLSLLIFITSLITVLVTFSLYWGEYSVTTWSPAYILIIAAIPRFFFLFRPAELSDDIFRYLWDGGMTLRGLNPYSVPPALFPVNDESTRALLSHVNHTNLVTIYPPASQFLFALGTFFGGIQGIKALMIIVDLIACAVILKILSHMKMPLSRAVIYAWHPLPIIEIAGSGHIDGAGILFLLLSFLTLARPISGLSPRNSALLSFATGSFFSFAVLVKLVPLVFFPALLFLAGKRCLPPLVAGFTAGLALLSTPFLPDLKNMIGTLGIYLLNWEFSGFGFRLLRKIASSGTGPRLILAFLFLTFSAVVYISLFLQTGDSNSTQQKKDCPASLRASASVAMAFLLSTPTLHPWYALYLACLLPFFPFAGGIVLTWAVFLSYRVLIPFTTLGKWIEDDTVPALIFFGALSALLLPRLIWIVQNSFLSNLIKKREFNVSP